MGFCKRCGDIVSGPRCKCGGSSVSGVVQWNQGKAQIDNTDKWSKTYVTRDKSPTRLNTASCESDHATSNSFPVREVTTPTTPLRRFPRPVRGAPPPLENSVSAHIASTMAFHPPFPLKQTSSISDELASAQPADILPSPYTSSLSKAYGSVLQSKETLSTYTCFACSTPFPPDATIYPDPTSQHDKTTTTNTRFLCRPCFTKHGGSKGMCASCARSVLILASEGGFVENAGRVWHKRCFRCEGCFKNIGDAPMIDLLGRPSCTECFDSCLKRKDSPRRQEKQSPAEMKSNIGGMRGKSRESSPALEELEQRLGIQSCEGSPAVDPPMLSGKNREGSPLIERGGRLSLASPLPTSRTGGDGSPSPMSRSQRFKSPEPTEDAIEEMKRRFLRRSSASPMSSPSTTLKASASSSPVRSPNSVTSSATLRDSDFSSTPDLVSDFSDTTQSSSPSTPPTFSPPNRRDEDDIFGDGNATTPTPKSRHIPSLGVSIPESPRSTCAACSQPLFNVKGGGSFVTVPHPACGAERQSYHAGCFRCAICKGQFTRNTEGQAVFVRNQRGICHIECAPAEKVADRSPSRPVLSTTTRSNSFDRPPLTAPLPATNSSTPAFPRFGSSTSCPGCHKSVSPMERGVVPGPQGSRWHGPCLVCGGKDQARERIGRRDVVPGCGKKLDSAAKIDGVGGVWCRECLILLSTNSPVSSQGSPIRSPIAPMQTGAGRFPGTASRIVPQYTGTTTLVRQFTGMGGDALMRQLTGGGLSPTRQLMTGSPTKQLGSSPTKNFTMGSGRMRPRPKSVVGLRTVDEGSGEGRGMFLVRQMTGGGRSDL